MKKRTRRGSFDQLTHSEREAIYQKCNRIRPEDGRPLNEIDRRKHRQAGLRVGRPRIGRGAKRINVSIEKGLLRTADAFAEKHGISRANLIARSVQAYITGAA